MAVAGIRTARVSRHSPMRTIARGVGCSPSTLVHRFGTRQAMLRHVITRHVGERLLEGLYQWAPDPAQLLPVTSRGWRGPAPWTA